MTDQNQTTVVVEPKSESDNKIAFLKAQERHEKQKRFRRPTNNKTYSQTHNLTFSGPVT